jgi:hypothetical protein
MISDESLKAIFISNFQFFKQYPIVIGMTGTVGGEE